MTARAFESRLVCTGCGAEAERDDPFAFRCPAAEDEAGEKGDHVLARELDLTETSFPQPSEEDGGNPFVRYRELLHSWRLARRRGMPDAGYVRLVHELDGAVAEVDGRGFVVTPYARNEALGKELGLESGGWGGPSGGRGGLWIKDETANVAGSHKARHLMGLALLFEVARRTGDARPVRLAVASCGPAALAAAVIARASARPLDAYVPPNANEVVVRNLMDLGAKLHVCERPADGPPGDPCQHRFRKAVRPGGTGALPFTCQGSENGLVIEGAQTLGWEIVTQHAAAGGGPIDRVAIQVGGGALASAVIAAFHEAYALGAIEKLPRFHAVQAEGGHPLERAWRRLVCEIVRMMERRGVKTPGEDAKAAHLARWLVEVEDDEAIRRAIDQAPRQRSIYMTPWKPAPASAATGILDDETYDWLAIVRAMIETGGWPVVVAEKTIARAHELGREATGIDVGHTGAAGLAGLLALHDNGALDRGENAVAIFTGSW